MSQGDKENYLMNGESPPIRTEEIYRFGKAAKEQFGEVWGSETHSRRRKLILEKHKEVAQLLVPDKPYTIILAVVVVSISLLITYLVKDQCWWVFLPVCYLVGGTLNHMCHVLIHDFTHNAGHSSVTLNKAMAIFCNIPMAVPAAISFGKYHSDHHNYLGELEKDPDMPTLPEVRFFRGPLGKSLFLLLLSMVYSLRPLFCFQRKMVLEEYVNMLVIAVTDCLIYKYWGINAVIYLAIGTYLSIGPHPAAMHVLAEHYEYVKGLQTYNYFGVWNIFNLNLGYHTEHHDFPTCPWYNLPKVRAAAPEFYQYLPHHTSYFMVALKFVLDPNFNLYNRTLRHNTKTD